MRQESRIKKASCIWTSRELGGTLVKDRLKGLPGVGGGSSFLFRPLGGQVGEPWKGSQGQTCLRLWE